MKPGEEFQPLMDDIFREKVLRARRMTPAERVNGTFELFDMGVGLMRDGIRAQHSDWNEDQVSDEVRRRFARIRQVEEHGIYQLVPPT